MMVACTLLKPLSQTKCSLSNMNCIGHFMHQAPIIFCQFLSASSTDKLRVKTDDRNHVHEVLEQLQNI